MDNENTAEENAPAAAGCADVSDEAPVQPVQDEPASDKEQTGTDDAEEIVPDDTEGAPKAAPKRPGLIKRMISHILEHKIYIFVFLVPALLLFAAYAAFRVHPFGDMSVLVLDLNGQYVYYYENLRDALHGNGSLVNSWSRNLTGEIMGMYAYYLASPFVIIPMLLPRAMMTESLLIMQLCKIGTASVTFFIYLRRSRGSRESTAFIFSIMYSLMPYMIVQLMNPMWLDGMIYLPLIILGIEDIINGKGWVSFIIPLALMYMAHFYIGWMITFFSIIYFLYYYFAGKKVYKFSFKSFVASGCKFAAGGIMAACAASWVLIPLYHSLALGKFEFSKPNYTMKTQFDFLEFFKNVLPNVYDTCRPEGSPVIYCGVVTVILLPLFFLNSRIRFREKMGLGAVLLTVLLSMYMSTVDLAWHGMQVPNWLPYRYSFTFSFIMLVIGAITFERLQGITLKDLGVTAVALMVYAFYVGKQEFKGVDLILTVWYTVIFTFVYSVFIKYIKTTDRKCRAVLTYILGVIVCGEMFGSTLTTLFDINKDVVYSKYSSYNRYITLGRETVQRIYEKDPFEESGVYRIEKDYHRTVNDALAMGSFGISHSSSTLNAAPIQFLRRLGYSYGGHYIKYKGGTYISDSILGIKYVMDKETVESDKFPENKSYKDLLLSNSDGTDTFAVYENPYALPVAFMADKSIMDIEFDLDDPFENQNLFLSHIVGEVDKEYFHRVAIKSTVPENAKQSSYGSHVKYTPIEEGKNCHIEYILKAPNENMMYFYMPSSYERKVNLWLNKEFLDYYFEGGNMCIQTLGRFEQGEQISFIVTVTEEKKEVLFKDKMFCWLDEAAFKEDIEKAKEHGLNVTSFKEDHLTGDITADKDGIMLTTISWEPGWTIYVDGVETEPVEVLDALIGVPLTAGHHTIEMKFFPEGLKTGIVVSISGVIAIIALIFLEPKKKKESDAA
ncbi:MAG: YfhO family protein [Oscillospiraceae bacterium]|nr:YfhO family protein [Oscillospiraceae bacterium]